MPTSERLTFAMIDAPFGSEGARRNLRANMAAKSYPSARLSQNSATNRYRIRLELLLKHQVPS